MTIVLALLAMAIADAVEARADEPPRGNLISVVVVDLHSSVGQMDCALFGSADGFPDNPNKAIKTTIAKVENSQARCDFSGVAAGDYAVAVFHDENSNGELDRNFIGIPKEGVGASNGATGKFGPPRFDDARFTYKGGSTTLTIRLTYLLAPL
jgi:uncharacterized protein (DUF2141 family)